MHYKREKDDEELDAVNDNFTEENIKQFFQKVVEREMEEDRKMGGAISGFADNGANQIRA